jgi:twinkle protein
MDKPLVPHGEYRDLTKRGISSATCEKWGYHLAEFNGKAVQVANYRDPDTHQLVAQKVRFANKDFTTRGDFKQAPLYGQWLWRDGGKMIVITEGEIDALTVSQLQNNKWPVVSLQSGAQAAKKSIQNALDWLEKFETVVLMFDDDEPGQKAAKACAPLFTPGKCKVARIPGFKDANEALVAGKGALVIDAMWGAKVHRPDGIVAGADTLALALEVVPNADAPYPWPAVNEFIKGLRKRELVTITAGTGIGKSTVCREIAASLLKSGERVGYVALEESVQRTVTGFVGIELNTPLHLDRGGITDAQITEAWQSMCGDGNLFLYDHFGSVESDNLVNKVRYLTHGCGCEWIVIDHISIAISGLEIVDERKGIDVMMTRLRSLVEETGVGLLLVSHLKRVEGNRGHEDGVQVSLGHLRGSQAIAQLSDMVIALERNQQGDDGDGNIATVRVLKNRRSGRTGIAGYLEYVISTGRLIESSASNPFTDADTKSDF